MTTPPDTRLQRLLGGTALAPLRLRLRRHFERLNDVSPPGEGSGEGSTARVLHLSRLSPVEQEALALLTGRPARTTHSMRLDMAAIDATLQAAGVCSSLREALERLDGPIIPHARLRSAQASAWADMLGAGGRDPRLQAWLETPSGRSLVRRLARQQAPAAASLLAQADAVLRRLPAQGLPRAQLAAETLGNAHSLDAGQPAASLVLAAWRHHEAPAGMAQQIPAAAAEALDGANHSEPRGPQSPNDPALDEQIHEERIRDIWARAGVLVNELARPALALNLPLQAAAAAPWPVGEPGWLSLRLLLRTPPAWAVAGRRVYVCENPNLLAIAADRLGAACAPMVCTEGMPAAAQRTLLNQLAGSGALLHYHGDFDWPGVRIANHVLRTWCARPWRMDTAAYEAVAQRSLHRPCDLGETAVEACWDARLAPTMARMGLSVAEEAVADTLMADLRIGP